MDRDDAIPVRTVFIVSSFESPIAVVLQTLAGSGLEFHNRIYTFPLFFFGQPTPSFHYSISDINGSFDRRYTFHPIQSISKIAFLTAILRLADNNRTVAVRPGHWSTAAICIRKHSTRFFSFNFNNTDNRYLRKILHPLFVITT